MPLESLIERHRKLVRAARREQDILQYTIEAVKELGFNRVALVQSAWFVRHEPRYICLDNGGDWHDVGAVAVGS